MSEATTRAWAASAEALRENMLAYAGMLLDLDIFRERLTVSSSDPYGVDVVVECPHGAVLTIPLVTTSMKEWRRRGPGSPTEMLVRALGRLAMTRVWRKRDTIAPPAGLLMTNGLGKLLVERAGIEPQAFFDATWTPNIHIGEKYSDTADWMGSGTVTPLLARAPAADRKRIVDLPTPLPWMSGYSALDAVFVEAVELDERLALIWKPQDSTGFEIRLPANLLPETLKAAAIGRPFSSYVSHPLLDRLDLEIDGVMAHQKSLRMKVRGGAALWRRVRLKGGNEDRRDLNTEVRALRDGRRHLEKVIAGHLTIPGHRGDVQVPWDLLDDEDIDEFTGKPWLDQPTESFEGISSRRRREERQHDDDDPIIRFDEDDPASYE